MFQHKLGIYHTMTNRNGKAKALKSKGLSSAKQAVDSLNLIIILLMILTMMIKCDDHHIDEDDHQDD